MYSIFTDNYSIPIFNHEGVLPPYLENPTNFENSPYKTYIGDIIYTFATSKQRCNILRGLITLRDKLFRLGFSGFQWLGGSFVENISIREDREPNDIDVVNFVMHDIAEEYLVETLREHKIITLFKSKNYYLCDSYFVDISNNKRHKNISPLLYNKNIIDQTRYWYGLFSHTRDNLWKGMLEVDIPYSPREIDFCLAMIDDLEDKL